ncbi:MAG: enolase C-terminal domain-like protein [Candidatus Micrarchaeaceae archaeon]
METAMIKDIKIRKIFDSKGNYTVEVAVSDGRLTGIASSPSGTSTSKYEAVAFPEGNVDLGIRRLNALKSQFIGIDAHEQKSIDELLHEIDGMHNFSYIGGNVATALSIASAKLAALEDSSELYAYLYDNFTKRFARKSIPRFIGNVVGGGMHSSSNMSIQEILVSPDSKNPMTNAYINLEIHKAVGEQLHGKGIPAGVNIENAWVTPYNDIENLSIVYNTAKSIEEKFGIKIDIGIDFAASEFYNGKYNFSGLQISKNDYIARLKQLFATFDISYMEDPIEENDFEGFSYIASASWNKAMVVGDDLYATHYDRLLEGIKRHSTNAVLIKVNQVGTLSDAIKTAELAKRNGIEVIVSHRSGETLDNFIAHIAVAFGAKMLKCGIRGGERISKINEIIRISESF